MTPFSGLADKTMTRGRPYKFALLNIPEINTLWENYHDFILTYQILMKLADLERRSPRIT